VNDGPAEAVTAGEGRQGRFITFEGVDGSGKTTQIARFAERLRAEGRRVTVTREPGGSPGAEAIRALLVEGEPGRWSPETEILLFTAARRDHLERVVRPALSRGDVVLCDRFADSTRVYQGAVRGELRPLVDAIHRLAVGIEPDLTLILDLEPAEALRRFAARGEAETRFERFGPEFQVRLRHGFLALAGEFPERCRLVSAAGSPEAVADRIAFTAREVL
jgi:dTMP kinase